MGVGRFQVESCTILCIFNMMLIIFIFGSITLLYCDYQFFVLLKILSYLFLLVNFVLLFDLCLNFRDQQYFLIHSTNLYTDYCFELQEVFNITSMNYTGKFRYVVVTINAGAILQCRLKIYVILYYVAWWYCKTYRVDIQQSASQKAIGNLSR